MRRCPFHTIGLLVALGTIANHMNDTGTVLMAKLGRMLRRVA